MNTADTQLSTVGRATDWLPIRSPNLVQFFAFAPSLLLFERTSPDPTVELPGMNPAGRRCVLLVSEPRLPRGRPFVGDPFYETKEDRRMTYAKPAQVLVTTMTNPTNQNIALRQKISAAVAKLRLPCDHGPSAMQSVPSDSLQARLSPIDQRGRWKSSLTIDIKDFDERGITFYHQLPLSDRRAMLVIESPQFGRLAAEVDLTWCRFNRAGQYTSGGRFVQRASKSA